MNTAHKGLNTKTVSLGIVFFIASVLLISFQTITVYSKSDAVSRDILQTAWSIVKYTDSWHQLGITYTFYMPLIFTPEPNIAFVSDRDDNFEIYFMYSDGRIQNRITNNSAEDIKPQWSPDGAKIGFVSYRDGNYEIYTMNSKGAEVINLTNHTARDDGFAWSPDGSKIAFESNRNAVLNLFVMDSNGTNVIQLTTDITHTLCYDSCYRFTWSPDSTKIAFSSTEYSEHSEGNLYVINADGTGLTQLTNLTGGWVGEPAWSPDGKMIAFAFKRPFSLPTYHSPNVPPSLYSDIYVLIVDTTQITSLATGFYTRPAWSPDGKKIGMIEFVSSTNFISLYTMNADGSDLTNLGVQPSKVHDFAWSRGSDQILFSAGDLVGSNIDIYIMNADGSNPINLTNNNPANDFGVTWKH